MGQSLKKLTPGNEGKTAEIFGKLAGKFYDQKFTDSNKQWTFTEFYVAVCEIIEEMNGSRGYTQFRVPNTVTLKRAFDKHHEGRRRPLTRDEFREILQDVIMETGVTGIGAKDILLYIFGVPITTLFIKQRTIPQAVPNEIFIPAVTSATVFVLAKLNKI